MARVIPDFDEFAHLFPHVDLTRLTEMRLVLLWNVAVSIVGDDDGNSFAPYQPDNGVIERQQLLYLVLAHLCQLQTSVNSGLSGRVTSASEGSVSVSVDNFKADSMTAQWWTQTQDGAMYWMLTAKYRLGGRLYGGSNFHPWG